MSLPLSVCLPVCVNISSSAMSYAVLTSLTIPAWGSSDWMIINLDTCTQRQASNGKPNSNAQITDCGYSVMMKALIVNTFPFNPHGPCSNSAIAEQARPSFKLSSGSSYRKSKMWLKMRCVRCLASLIVLVYTRAQFTLHTVTFVCIFCKLQVCQRCVKPVRKWSQTQLIKEYMHSRS